jgi:hypothetical protein
MQELLDAALVESVAGNRHNDTLMSEVRHGAEAANHGVAGDLDLELVQHLGHPDADVLAAVVSVERQDVEPGLTA